MKLPNASPFFPPTPAAGERQLNMVSWNGNPPKYDIRDWSPDGSRMGKGISLTEEGAEDPEGHSWTTWSW